MRGYSLEIPGRKHDCCEDSHYALQFQSRNGEIVGIYVVGDGLSGYDGLRASHFAVKTVSERIRDSIVKKGVAEACSVVREEIKAVNELLSKFSNETKTTLDVLITSNTNLSLWAHLGDSRIYAVTDTEVLQLTDDESDGSRGPSNYLGMQYIHAISIEERIVPKKCETPKAFFMTTDGLRSRVPEQYIKETILQTRRNPQELLDKLAAEVHIPRLKVKELGSSRCDDLYKILQENTLLTTQAAPEDKLTRIIEAYQQQQNKDLVDAVDRLLPFDDVAMIYVDLEDQISMQLAELDQLRITIPDADKRYNEIIHQHNILNNENQRLNEQSKVLEQKINDYTARIQQLDDENNALTAKLQEYEENLKRKESEINDLNLNLGEEQKSWSQRVLAKIVQFGCSINDAIDGVNPKRRIAAEEEEKSHDK